ncbi:hypothetical protein V5F49_12885 [Xanthobacter sp. V3C-3]|uniref:hypothetical protein n=1 Tax=Xanthobacter lutulentifluminis TaxID=3119935 RepID=UPI00372A9421
MRQLLNLFGGVAGLAVACLAGFALFTLVGGLILIAGIVITALVIGGGVYALITGKAPGMGRGGFGGVRVFEIRTGRPYAAPAESEMIDVTPPKPPRRDGSFRP